MTANQINFAKLNEDIRHNQATEQEAMRHNVEDESIRRDANVVSREKIAVEAYNYERQNAINEEHYGRMDAETARAHMAGEAIERKNAESNYLNAKANLRNAKTNARNAETNARNADINARNADINQQNANTNAKNAKTNAKNAKSNRIQAEAATSQAKSAALNAQTNAKNADTNARNADINQYNAVHDASYKSASTILRQGELNEDIRHNKETELVAWNEYNLRFITTPTADVKIGIERDKNDISKAGVLVRRAEVEVNAAKVPSEIEKNKAITEREKAAASESLARAGLLRTQDEWYTWNEILNTTKTISDAVKIFTHSK